jgi:hypothetical protein
VSLEPKGLKLIAAHAPDSEGIYDAIARSFGQERLDQLFKLLRELEETLVAQTANPEGRAPPVARPAARRRAAR